MERHTEYKDDLSFSAENSPDLEECSITIYEKDEVISVFKGAERWKMCARNFEVVFLTLMKHAAFTVCIEGPGYIVDVLPLTKHVVKLERNCINLFYEKKTKGILQVAAHGEVNIDAFNALLANSVLVNHVLASGDFTSFVNGCHNHNLFRDRGFRSKLESFMKKIHPEYFTGSKGVALLGLEEPRPAEDRGTDQQEQRRHCGRRLPRNPPPPRKIPKAKKKPTPPARKDTNEKASKPKLNPRLSLKQWPIRADEEEKDDSETDEREQEQADSVLESQEIVAQPLVDAPKEVVKNEEPGLNDCCVCFENQRNCVFIPCGHLCTCLECGKALKECPICRKGITIVQQVFHA